MATIYLKEEFNHLKIEKPYKEIVCGNKNYEISISFSSDWSDIENKLAVFVVGGQKTAVEFSGNSFSVPALPNASTANLVIMTAESESNQLVTEPFELALSPTLQLEQIEEFEPISNYAQTVLAKLSSIENGTLTVKNAEYATRSGVAENASNPNLLINGAFKINQRASTTYACTKNEYTADRWMGYNGLTVTLTSTGVTLSATANGMFQQKLETAYSELAGKTVTISAKVNGQLYYISGTLPENEPASQIDLIRTNIGSNGGTNQDVLRLTYINGLLSFNIYVYAGSSMAVEYAKLEVGASPTLYSPRPYAEELSLCQRFYYRLNMSNRNNSSYGEICLGVVNSSTSAIFSFSVGSEMRTIPTITKDSSTYYVRTSESVENMNIVNSYSVYTFNKTFMIIKVFVDGELLNIWSVAALRPSTSEGYISFDAEIY